MAENKSENIEEIDEAEEEALLKSDDENVSDVKKEDKRSEEAKYEDSLMQESTKFEEGIKEDSENDNSDDHGQSDSDDEDDVDEIEKMVKEYKELVAQLEKHQYAYDKYVRLCELSHAIGDLDYIRNAYNLFSAIYPLAPELWLKLLKIEESVALSPKEIENLEGLFRRALRDYYSFEIASLFSALAKRTCNAEVIWREVLGTYGLDCMKGQQLFQQYRQYITTHPTMSSKEKQFSYIQSFLQELKYPHFNMEESYIEFKVFYEKNKAQISHEIDWQLLDKNYFKAKDHLEKILPFEEKLKTLEKNQYTERSQIYLNYINESDKFLDENILQIVYERMVTDCCLNAGCWLSYIDFIDYRDEFGRPEDLQDLPVFQQTSLDISNRALRNCTWAEKLYIKLIELLEKMNKSREEIQEVLESSMSAGFQTPEPVVAIWLEYLTYLRRHTNWENEDECDILRKNFNLCWTILGQQWGVLADCNCEILQFWGRLEYGPLQDSKRGKELWTTVMESSDNATKSGLWIEFIQMEMRCDLESARRLYRKALITPGLDNPFVIASAWQRFERCNGTIKSLKTSLQECEKVLQQITTTINSSKGSKRKSNARSEIIPEKKPKSVDQIEKPSNVTHSSNAKATASIVTSIPITAVEATASITSHQKETAFKEHENQEIDLAKDHLRIFLSNLDYNLTENELRLGLPELKIVNINLIRSANGKSRGFCYLELETTADVEKALTLDRRPLNGRPVYISSVLRDKEKRQKFKYSDGLEPTKLFLKGLPHNINKEELEEIYTVYGKLKDVRLVYHKSGKFKSIAYVEYEDEHAAAKAVMATDQMELHGHVITVAISAPPPKPSDPVIIPSKLLGINTKRPKVFDQKPRMFLIPTAVRKKLDIQATQPPQAHGISAPRNAEANGATPKTNEDFRKLLKKS